MAALLSLSKSSAWSGSSSLRKSCCHSSHASFPSLSVVCSAAGRLAGQMEADVMLERAVALASGCMLLGMRLYALELCSVY